MRTDLNSSFIAKLSENGRHPFQVLVFSFPDGDVSLSDSERTFNGVVCEPIVESWGMISDTVDISSYISNNTAASRQMSITILNTGRTPFATRFKATPPENVIATLYQGFDDLSDIDAEIIDEFVVQDPISWSEASMLLDLDLVSKNLYANPYIGTLGSNQEFAGVVLGSVAGVPGTPSGDHPMSTLNADITASSVTISVFDDVLEAGFTSSGTIVINFEKISYTGVSGGSFTGCTRGVSVGAEYSPAFPHAEGARVYQGDHEYLYNFTAGPVDFMGAVYVDGVIYAGVYTQYKDRNPTQIGFLDGPPWTQGLGVQLVDRVNTSQANNSCWQVGPTNSDYGGWDNCDNLDGCSITGEDNGDPYTHPNIDFGANGIFNENIQYHSNLDEVFVNWKFRTIPRSGFPTIIYQILYNNYLQGTSVDTGISPHQQAIRGTDAAQDYTLSGNSNSITEWNQLFAINGHNISVVVNGLNSCFTVATTYCLFYDVSYTLFTRDHAGSTQITCDFSSGDGPINPADALLQVLAKIGIEASADAATFETARQWYTVNSYSFEGFIPGYMRTREVLISMLQQCHGRLLNNGGGIKLVVREHLGDGPIEKVFNSACIRQKSLSITRQNVSAISNHLTARYDSNADGSFNEQLLLSDPASIAAFGKHEDVVDFFLIQEPAMANSVLSFLLAELKDPHSFIKFQAFLDAFPMERDDDIQLFTSFNKMQSGAVCKVAFSNRIFGSGKNHQINRYEITAYTKDEFLGFLLTGDSTTVTADNTIITTDQG